MLNEKYEFRCEAAFNPLIQFAVDYYNHLEVVVYAFDCFVGSLIFQYLLSRYSVCHMAIVLVYLPRYKSQQSLFFLNPFDVLPLQSDGGFGVVGKFIDEN